MGVSDEVKVIRLLRHALASIWTGLECEAGLEEAAGEVQVIAEEALKLSADYARRGKDLADDSVGLESWRRSVAKGGTVIKEPW